MGIQNDQIKEDKIFELLAMSGSGNKVPEE